MEGDSMQKRPKKKEEREREKGISAGLDLIHPKPVGRFIDR